MFVTVGHSNLPLEDFLALLRSAAVSRVVDVRRLAGSTRYPQFNADVLAAYLAEAGIEYGHSDGLTGRRPRQRNVDPNVNGQWQNQSFHNYADWALGDEFARSLDELVAGAHGVTAVMCAEAVWWRCHRRLIADNLLVRGLPVKHLMSQGTLRDAVLSDGAVVRADGRVTYPASSS